ncbi:hypothetical protein BU25DRAFT_263679 [Macroventuria anomochaeta]|uniref:Uncharacterized protein n=1 Tax=Macroventuria anomochaeta TaxID=301207 RepID=A0ACB6S932_9PLEO|nr:uncharacterized protein BU25DRAFT_263679 [Macroventuria anomochaeta]KAF2630027.1 hypothetical protein BU25DRAFT_263679 [Macroventuria anomochaeta]
MPIIYLSILPLFAAFALFTPPIAQTIYGTSICNPQTNYQIVAELNNGSYHNSSGTRSFTWNNTAARNLNVTEPWQIDLLVNDTIRDVQLKSIDNAAVLGTNKGYLSVPDGVRSTSFSIYQLAPVNATSDGDRSNGCSGVLSSGCIDYLRSAVLTTSPSTSCADSRLGENPRDEAVAACGTAFSTLAKSGHVSFYTSFLENT